MPDPWPYPPGAPWPVDAWERWPVGIRKVELWQGCPVFYAVGEWGDGDVAAAERACTGWKAILMEEGTMMFLVPADDPEPRFTPLDLAYAEFLRGIEAEGGGVTLDEYVQTLPEDVRRQLESDE